MNNWYRFSLLCSLLPLLGGVAIFVAWNITQADSLVIWGLFNIIIGLGLFIPGLAALFFARRKFKHDGLPSGRKILLGLALLLVNFPVAVGIVGYAEWKLSVYNVTFDNQYASAVDFVFTDPLQNEVVLEDVPQGSSVHELRFLGEGTVSYIVRAEGLEKYGTLFGYISSNLKPPAVSVTITAAGEVNVIEEDWAP